MNKIKCDVLGNTFEDLPVGTIFVWNGDFYIKIDEDDIFATLQPANDCDFMDFEVDRDTIPNAVRLDNGVSAIFGKQSKIDIVYPNATLSIN